MTQNKKSNLIISIALIIVIIIAIGVLVYINLPQEKNKQVIKQKGYVNIFFGEDEYNYTMQKIQEFDSISGSGSFIKLGWLPEIKIDGPFNYTGIEIPKLLQNIENLPDRYDIKITASDGRISNYTYNETLGIVDIYNETGNTTEYGNVSMVLAYMKDDDYIIDTDEGPLRIAFIDGGAITSSSLWTKMVVSIEIVEI
jgi:hypothetical protein